MSLHLGQRVICIRGWSAPGYGLHRPELYDIATIRAFCPCADIPALLFHEYHNCEVRFARTLLRGEASFAANHFRPLFNISELEKLLIEAKVDT